MNCLSDLDMKLLLLCSFQVICIAAQALSTDTKVKAFIVNTVLKEIKARCPHLAATWSDVFV